MVPITTNRHRQHTISMSDQSADFTPCVHRPQSHRVISAATHNMATVGTEGHGPNFIIVTAESLHLLAGLKVPQPNGPIAAA
jgi:hypothetical protein